MFLSADLAQLTAVLARQRLPAIYAEKEYVHAGGLVSYGPDYPDLFRRAAAYTDKILKGMRLADYNSSKPPTAPNPTGEDGPLSVHVAQVLAVPKDDMTRAGKSENALGLELRKRS